MPKLTTAMALGLVGGLAAALPAAPGQAQQLTPDASAFQGGPWSELGTLDDGATLSISQARYRDGAVLTFALRTEHAAGQNAATIEVIELDCAAARYRRLSAATTRRNGEMAASNAPGALESYPEGSVMAQIAGPLCRGAGGN